MKVINLIPTYNEEKNIGLMVKVLLEIDKKEPKHQLEVLVVDANSKDKTQKVVKGLQKESKKIHLLTGPRKGLGYDLVRGLKYATEELKADLVIPNDADFQWDPKNIPQMIRKIEQGYDVVVASRHVKGGEVEKWSWFRKLNHWLANDFFGGFVAGIKEVQDHTGSFKAIRVKGHLNKVNFDKLNVKGFVIQNELLYQLSKTGAKFTEIPVKFHKRKRGDSKVGFNQQYLKDTLEWVKSCLLIRYDRIKNN